LYGPPAFEYSRLTAATGFVLQEKAMTKRTSYPLRPGLVLVWWIGILAAASAQVAVETPVVEAIAQESAAIPALPAPAAPAPVSEKAAIVHEVTIEAPATHVVEVKSTIPTDGRNYIELMMSRWTPGFYRIENYADDVQAFNARLPGGTSLAVEKLTQNRWRINTLGEPQVIVSYRLVCERGSVARSYVGDDFAVICGGPTYLTLVGADGQPEIHRPHEVHLQFPPRWGKSATGLPPAPDGFAHHYRASNFDILIDSPIAIGNPSIQSFYVADSRHHLVDLGSPSVLANWNSQQAAADIEKIVAETRNFWGFLPFQEYFFLNKLSAGGGGLEHLNSTLIHTSPPDRPTTRTGLRWLNFVSHEYFHSFNVKRLRPVELGPFDYENARRTSGLWVAEGLTNYFNSLIVARAGVATPVEYLETLSGHIRSLQTSPSRLTRSLAAMSLETWGGDGFGQPLRGGGRRGGDDAAGGDAPAGQVAGGDGAAQGDGVGRGRGGRGRGGRGGGRGGRPLDYYVKGPVVGFLLDAKIRRATDNKKSLDDVMRLAYRRYAGERGYTEQEFLDTAAEVAGIDLKEFFDKALFSTDELSYDEALDWFGLRFAPAEDGGQSWNLEVLPEASDEQKARFAAYLEPSHMHVAELAYVAPVAAPAPMVAAAMQPLAIGLNGVPAQQPAPQQPAQRPSQQPAEPPPQLVDGLGGVFLFSTDAPRLADWYANNLGLPLKAEEGGAFVCQFAYRQLGAPAGDAFTMWAILPTDRPRGNNPPPYQINYRVKDMNQTLAHLRSRGVAVEKSQDYAYGRFAWVLDPDGNRVELFQALALSPAPAATPQTAADRDTTAENPTQGNAPPASTAPANAPRGGAVPIDSSR
jgi:predicted metalloprotease with PDZ domain/catechol 2,3-dioxygenase-like lactoylglutathione lyase family enzyme